MNCGNFKDRDEYNMRTCIFCYFFSFSEYLDANSDGEYKCSHYLDITLEKWKKRMGKKENVEKWIQS